MHNLLELGLLPPIYMANNTIVDSRVINPTFTPMRYKVVVSVINPTYHIQNLLINKATTIKYIKRPENNGVGYTLGSQVVKLLYVLE